MPPPQGLFPWKCYDLVIQVSEQGGRPLYVESHSRVSQQTRAGLHALPALEMGPRQVSALWAEGPSADAWRDMTHRYSF